MKLVRYLPLLALFVFLLTAAGPAYAQYCDPDDLCWSADEFDPSLNSLAYTYYSDCTFTTDVGWYIKFWREVEYPPCIRVSWHSSGSTSDFRTVEADYANGAYDFRYQQKINGVWTDIQPCT